MKSNLDLIHPSFLISKYPHQADFNGEGNPS